MTTPEDANDTTAMEIETDEPDPTMDDLMRLLDTLTPPPVPEVRGLVRALERLRDGDSARVYYSYGPELEPLEIRWARRLDLESLSDVMRVVHTLDLMGEEARRVRMALRIEQRRNPTTQTVRDYLASDNPKRMTDFLRDTTWNYMYDRRQAMSLEDVFAERERVRRGAGNYSGACRTYIVGQYMQRLYAVAAAHNDAQGDLLGRLFSIERPHCVDVHAVDREIAFWTRWQGFLAASDQQMDITFGAVRTRYMLEDLGRMREQALDNLAWEVWIMELEVEDIQSQAGRWIAVALGTHRRVGASSLLRSLEGEVVAMIMGFARMGEPAPAAQADADADM